MELKHSDIHDRVYFPTSSTLDYPIRIETNKSPIPYTMTYVDQACSAQTITWNKKVLIVRLVEFPHSRVYLRPWGFRWHVYRKWLIVILDRDKWGLTRRDLRSFGQVIRCWSLFALFTRLLLGPVIWFLWGRWEIGRFRDNWHTEAGVCYINLITLKEERKYSATPKDLKIKDEQISGHSGMSFILIVRSWAWWRRRSSAI